MFLDVAKELLRGNNEAHRRAATGRAYYSLMLECRDALARWEFAPTTRENVHTFVRLRFIYSAEPMLKNIGDTLERLGRSRNSADYDLRTQTAFASNGPAQRAIDDASLSIAVLHQIESDPQLLARACASIRTAFP